MTIENREKEKSSIALEIANLSDTEDWIRETISSLEQSLESSMLSLAEKEKIKMIITQFVKKLRILQVEIALEKSYLGEIASNNPKIKERENIL